MLTLTIKVNGLLLFPDLASRPPTRLGGATAPLSVFRYPPTFPYLRVIVNFVLPHMHTATHMVNANSHNVDYGTVPGLSHPTHAVVTVKQRFRLTCVKVNDSLT